MGEKKSDLRTLSSRDVRGGFAYGQLLTGVGGWVGCTPKQAAAITITGGQKKTKDRTRTASEGSQKPPSHVEGQIYLRGDGMNTFKNQKTPKFDFLHRSKKTSCLDLPRGVAKNRSVRGKKRTWGDGTTAMKRHNEKGARPNTIPLSGDPVGQRGRTQKNKAH